jgi:hypothetical protein
VLDALPLIGQNRVSLLLDARLDVAFEVDAGDVLDVVFRECHDPVDENLVASGFELGPLQPPVHTSAPRVGELGQFRRFILSSR